MSNDPVKDAFHEYGIDDELHEDCSHVYIEGDYESGCEHGDPQYSQEDLSRDMWEDHQDRLFEEAREAKWS